MTFQPSTAGLHGGGNGCRYTEPITTTPLAQPVLGAVGPVPHTPLEDLCLDFVNSEFTDHRGPPVFYDRLAMPGWWRWLVDRWGLGPCPRPGARDLEMLRELRTLCRRLIEGSGPVSRRDRSSLDTVLAATPLTWRLSPRADPPDLLLRPTVGGVPHVAAEIVVSLVEVLGGDRSRIRRCENPHCSFIFRDTSRNGLRRWCDPKICGNLVKVRAFRAASQGHTAA